MPLVSLILSRLRLPSPACAEEGVPAELHRHAGYGVAPVRIACPAQAAHLKCVGRTWRLVDGRGISVPLAWSWRLSDATPEQRNKYEIIGDGQGVHWPDVDEDLSVE